MWGVSGRAACQYLLLWINLPGPHRPVMGTGPFNPSHSKYRPCQSRGGGRGWGRQVSSPHAGQEAWRCAGGRNGTPSLSPPGQLLVMLPRCSGAALQGRLALPVLLTGEEKSGVCLCCSPSSHHVSPPKLLFFAEMSGSPLLSPTPPGFFSHLILAFISNYFFLSSLSLQRP